MGGDQDPRAIGIVLHVGHSCRKRWSQDLSDLFHRHHDRPHGRRDKKPIKDVKLGDEVMATDPETGETGPRKVLDLIRHGGLHTMVAARLSDGSAIDATDRHPFWVESRGEWVDAIDLQPGDVYALIVSRAVRPESKLSTARWWEEGDTTLGTDLGVADASTDEWPLQGRSGRVHRALADRQGAHPSLPPLLGHRAHGPAWRQDSASEHLGSQA